MCSAAAAAHQVAILVVVMVTAFVGSFQPTGPLLSVGWFWFNVIFVGGKVSRIYRTRNILDSIDCDQSNYSLRIILSHIPAKLLSDEKCCG